MRMEGFAKLELPKSEEEGELLPKGLEESMVRPEPLVLGGKGEVRWEVP